MEKEKIDKAINSFLTRKMSEAKATDAFVNEGYILIKDYILSGGKRLRPIISILSYELFKDKNLSTNELQAISALEFLHNASLMLDDLIDEDDERRNNPAMHKYLEKWFLSNIGHLTTPRKIFKDETIRFSTSSTVLSVLILISFGSSAILESKIEDRKKLRLLDEYEKCLRRLTIGELLDVLYEYKDKIHEKDYLKVSYLKSGWLFRSSAKFGAILANAPLQDIEKIGLFAFNAAISFQIQDDVLDLSEDSKKGRELGSDIKDGKKTIILLHALDNATDSEKKRLLSIVGNPLATEEEIKEAIDIIKSIGSIDYAKEKAKYYLDLAFSYLDKIEHKKSKNAENYLKELAYYLVSRKK